MPTIRLAGNTMRRAKQISLLVLVLLVLGVGTLFYIQNADQRTPLYFDLGIWGVQTEDKIAVPLLMYVSFAAGLAVMGIYTIYLRFRPDPRSRSRYGRDDTQDGVDDYDF